MADEPRVRDLASPWLAAEIVPMARLAGPVVLAELGWMVMGLVDIYMVGALGPTAIGGLGIGNAVFLGVSIFGYGLLLGLDTVVAQAFGAGRIGRCREALVQGLYLALAFTLPLMGLVKLAEGRLTAFGVDPDVVPQAEAYLDAVVWSLLPLLVKNACRRYLQGLGVVRPVMIALLGANLVNLAANWVLIHGRLGMPALGVSGSGWSTTLARFSMAVVTAVAVVLDDRTRRGAAGTRDSLWGVSWRPDRALLRELIRLGGPAGGQLLLEVGVFALATLLAGRLGAVPLAAHEIALSICGLTFMVPLGVSAAGAIRVGHALGRQDPLRASRAGTAALVLGVGFMGISAVAFLVAPSEILRLFTADSAVIAIGTPLLRIAALFQLFDGLQVVATGILRGAGETRLPFVINILAFWGLGLPIAAGLAFGAGLGVVGLWSGLCTGLIVTGLCLLGSWRARVRAMLRAAPGEVV